MWWLALALAVLGLAACSDGGGANPVEKSKRPVGMSEDIWKVYSGAESGVGDEPKDKSPDTKPPEKK